MALAALISCLQRQRGKNTTRIRWFRSAAFLACIVWTNAQRIQTRQNIENRVFGIFIYYFKSRKSLEWGSYYSCRILASLGLWLSLATDSPDGSFAMLQSSYLPSAFAFCSRYSCNLGKKVTLLAESTNSWNLVILSPVSFKWKTNTYF